MASSGYDYDMMVIGSGPAGQRAAIQAAKLDKKVAIAERLAVVGGVCTNTGTIPSKILRESALYLSGYRERGLYGESYVVKQNITMDDLTFRAGHVILHENDVTSHQIMRNRVEMIPAEASFVDSHTIRLTYMYGGSQRDVTTAHIIIATGSSSTKDAHIPFDGQRIFVSDDILELDRLPRTLTVVGAGGIGLEYASIFSTLGVLVTLIDKRSRLLPFVDSEIIDALAYHLRQNRVTLRLGEEVSGIEPIEDAHGERVRIHLASGKQVITEQALYSIGRTGATDSLNLGAAGLTADERGRLEVNERYQTYVPPYICRRRCDQLPQPRLHVHGAGAFGRLPRSGRRGKERACAVPLRDLFHPRDIHRGPQRGGTHRPRHSLRGGQGPVP